MIAMATAREMNRAAFSTWLGKCLARQYARNNGAAGVRTEYVHMSIGSTFSSLLASGLSAIDAKKVVSGLFGGSVSAKAEPILQQLATIPIGDTAARQGLVNQLMGMSGMPSAVMGALEELITPADAEAEIATINAIETQLKE